MVRIRWPLEIATNWRATRTTERERRVFFVSWDFTSTDGFRIVVFFGFWYGNIWDICGNLWESMGHATGFFVGPGLIPCSAQGTTWQLQDDHLPSTTRLRCCCYFMGMVGSSMGILHGIFSWIFPWDFQRFGIDVPLFWTSPGSIYWGYFGSNRYMAVSVDVFNKSP